MPDTTPNLALPEIAGAQAQKHVTHNEALRALDALVHLAVLDRDLAAPPASPAEGQRWLVAAGASGGWSGKANQIAAWQDGGWLFYAPGIGWLAYVIDEGALLAWSGADWEPALDMVGGASELQNMARLGLGTTADATNPFSARLNNALWAARTLAEGGDGDLRYKLSKEGAAKTLSLLFQTNFSGRAEIGLTGDDNFHFKVSADGTTWRDALTIDRATGAVTMPFSGGADSDLELTLAQLALQVADNANAALLLGSSGNRFADSFDALTYVDTAGATNLDTSVTGLLKPVSSATSYGNAGGSGNRVGSVTVSVAGFSQFSGSAVSNLVNGDLTGDGANDFGFGTNGASCVGYEIRFDFGTPKAVDEYKWHQQNANPQGSWKLQGATMSDYADAADLHPAEALATAAATTHSVASPGLYRYYRLVGVSGAVTSPGGGTWCTEVEFRIGDAVPGTGNLTVISTALAAASAPSAAKLVARVKEIDPVTPNIDLIFSVSRDGGTTWTNCSMNEKFTFGGVAVYDSTALDITAQPSGTSMKWKLASANGKRFELHGIYLSWS